jgi:hypothetical protein
LRVPNRLTDASAKFLLREPDDNVAHLRRAPCGTGPGVGGVLFGVGARWECQAGRQLTRSTASGPVEPLHDSNNPIRFPNALSDAPGWGALFSLSDTARIGCPEEDP